MNKYLSFVAFAHTIFALPFAIIGLALGIEFSSSTNFFTFLFALLCMVLCRNAAMSFNRIVDANIDKKNARTSNRSIPAGKIKMREAFIFCFINSILFILFAYAINPLCFYLSFLALFVVLFYSYTKRFSWLCHWVLGLALSFAPIGAFFAVHPLFEPIPVLLSLLVLFWVAGFDIIYALQDETFDKQSGLFSVPARFGYNVSVAIAIVNHIVCVCVACALLFFYDFGIFFILGLLSFCLSLAYQHVQLHRLGQQFVNAFFFKLNGFSSISFMLFFLLDRYL